MGNSLFKDENKLDFRNVHTEQFSDNIPYLQKLQNDAKLSNELFNKLNVEGNTQENRQMYDMFTNQDNDAVFSDTSPLLSEEGLNNSATSVANSEINQLLSKIQKGGGEEIAPFENAPVENTLGEYINADLFEQIFTEMEQKGGNLPVQYVNEDIMAELITETGQTGGFFWNKKQPEPVAQPAVQEQPAAPAAPSSNDTFINRETLEKLVENKFDVNETSANDTEMNQYMANAITELTSTLERNQTQQQGGNLSTSSDLSESEEVVRKSSRKSSKKSSRKSSRKTSRKSLKTSSHTGNNYESSSAHSDGVDSNNTMGSSTVSVNEDKYLSDSINTSDINMISVE